MLPSPRCTHQRSNSKSYQTQRTCALCPLASHKPASTRHGRRWAISISTDSAMRVQAKAFIQPSAGWLAAFSEDQVFVIEFPLHPRAIIHPDQGQVELYIDRDPTAPEAGLLELEVHVPYHTLAPGERMSPPKPGQPGLTPVTPACNLETARIRLGKTVTLTNALHGKASSRHQGWLGHARVPVVV